MLLTLVEVLMVPAVFSEFVTPSSSLKLSVIAFLSLTDFLPVINGQ